MRTVEVPPPATCRFDLDGAPGTRRDFFCSAPMLWPLVLTVRCLLIAGFDLISLVWGCLLSWCLVS